MKIEHVKRDGIEDWNDLAFKGNWLQAVLDPLGDDLKNDGLNKMHRAALMEVLKLKGDERVLDFGCGVGRISEWLSSYVREIVAIDTSPNMIQRAKEESHASNVIYQCKRLDEVTGEFDLILDIGVSCFFPKELREEVYKTFMTLAPRAIVSSDFGNGKFFLNELRR